MKHYYTKTNYKKLLDNMVILVDTRENSNDHIIEFFEQHEIQYKKRSLKTGDYSFYLPASEELGITRDEYFVDELCIERKNSVGELAGNIANANKDQDRIMREFNRMINVANAYLLIEDDAIEDIINGNYRSELNPDSFLRTILTWQKRNGMQILFVRKEDMGRMIYELCRNTLDNLIMK